MIIHFFACLYCHTFRLLHRTILQMMVFNCLILLPEASLNNGYVWEWKCISGPKLWHPLRHPQVLGFWVSGIKTGQFQMDDLFFFTEHGLPSGKLTTLWTITIFIGKRCLIECFFNSYVSFPEGTLVYTLYNIHDILYTSAINYILLILYILYTIHYILHTLYTIYLILYTIYYIPYYTLYNLSFLGLTHFVHQQEAARALLFSAEISRLQGEQEESNPSDDPTAKWWYMVYHKKLCDGWLPYHIIWYHMHHKPINYLKETKHICWLNPPSHPH